MPKYLGIDYGTKRVGVALSDDNGRIAFPHKVFLNDSSLVDSIQSLVKKEGIQGIVVGESRNHTGLENPVMEAARAFAEVISETVGEKVFFEPEFYSTQEARHMRDDSAVVDDSAAAVILQSFLDKKNTR